MPSFKDRLIANILDIQEKARDVSKSIVKTTDYLLIYLSVLGILTIVYRLGFPKKDEVDIKLIWILEFIAATLFVGIFIRFILTFNLSEIKKKLATEFSLIVALFLILGNRYIFPDWFEENIPFLRVFEMNFILYLAIVIVFLAEVTGKSLKFFTVSLNPARIFIYSFILLILIGTGLLLLPRATVNGITIIDALFTSTSAVCVTGLTVVDTETQFTAMGKVIIFWLFQIGGLGIMTFTSFFGFLFKGEFSYKNELFLQSIVNENKMDEIFKTLLKIIVITFSIEILGAIMIYFCIPEHVFESTKDRIFFSIFHSVSAFCNAGFSTFSEGLFHNNFRFNYNLQLIIAFLIIIGGLGFPIVFNFYRYIKHYVTNKWKQKVYHKNFIHAPRIIHLNTKLVVFTTICLIVGGTIFIYFLESGNSLKEHTWNGKIVTAFFSAVTPRTAGFNVIDMTTLMPATILIYLFLMWVGASPASTGGGIKTTTFALAFINTVTVAQGKEKIELFRREISEESVKRALTIIFMSTIVIGLAILLLTFTDPEKRMINIAFECFSAFSTVGLTLGVTPELSPAGKLIIIVVMLTGRVGIITFIIGFARKAKGFIHRYPKENIFIN
ncbi:MAG: TrkH family potassium uptake protein [Cytophagaceae bacterium]